MNKGKFHAGMEEAYLFLKKLSLVREKNVEMMKYCGSNKYSDDFRKLSRKNDYRKLYQYAIAYNQYDILLEDFSFIQFSFESYSNVIRMAYFPCPDVVVTYEEYLKQNAISENPVTPLRYDYSEGEYNGLIHSASHFHFGQNESIRLPMDKILTPYVFAVCVVNYYYYKIWKNELTSDVEFGRKITAIKQRCSKVSDTYFSDDERKYFYMC